MERRQVVWLPCLVGSLNSLRGGEDLVLVKLLVPSNGTAAWVNKQDVTILRQSAARERGLTAQLRSTLIDQDDKTLVVEIIDRNLPRRIEVPKVWLKQESSDDTGF